MHIAVGVRGSRIPPGASEGVMSILAFGLTLLGRSQAARHGRERLW